ncbi:transketolase [Clostridium polyendosporum]|uniref:Transketolase n=1 Tax=Clostridium polyendosporum TaxID=69208 RepID=A0A919VF37_9CLOT|nr:transketolase C-terminal domain-containing protein [Clostridium polyendosporum]GIM27722.1 transketolase [Clostridium polyendosporum]
MVSTLEMREVLSKTLEDLMEKDKKIILIDADLASANGTLSLRKKFPDRALDIGISEQNMASVAAGMSAYGLKPFISTFTAFASRRICDQIAISMLYAKQNVKIIATDSGISSQLNGGTHMSVEDIGVLRSIPNIVIYEAVDSMQLLKALPVIADYNGVVYIRMVRKDTPPVFDDNYQFDLFKGDLLKEGSDVTIIASGIMVNEALEASKILAEENINAEVINIHTIKPIDRECIISSAKKTGSVVTCENHNIIGGLYSAVCEVLSDECPVPIKAIGIKDHFGEVGKLPFLMNKYEMTKEYIVSAVKEVLELK